MRKIALDSASWSNKRSMVACVDEDTVVWLIGTVKKLDDQYGAWLNDEGPFQLKFTTKIPYPTVKWPTEELLDRIVVSNPHNHLPALS